MKFKMLLLSIVAKETMKWMSLSNISYYSFEDSLQDFDSASFEYIKIAYKSNQHYTFSFREY